MGKMVKAHGISIIFWGVILGSAVFNAFNLSGYADFNPLNGDFQNYNPVRRIMEGQIPFVDFEVYLGLGHAYLGAVFTKLFGGTFQASLYAMKFLTFMAFILTVYIILSCIIDNKVLVKSIVIVLAALDIAQFPNINAIMGTRLNEALSISLTPGNSARYIRSFIGALTPFAAYGLYRVIAFGFKVKKKQDLNVVAFCAPGLASGAALFWSNDYGMSSALIMGGAAFILCVRYFWKDIRKMMKALFCLLSGFICGGGLILLLVTRFHPAAYFQRTIGVSSYQMWYAVHDPGEKAYYIWDLFFKEPYVAAALGIIVLYVINILKRPLTESTAVRYGIPAIILATGYFTIHLYQFSDGGGTEYFTLLFFSICLGEIVRAAMKLWGKGMAGRSYKVYICAGLVGVAVLASQVIIYTTAKINHEYSDGTYVQGLGGNLKVLGGTVNATENNLAGKSIFSTYASAVETVTGQYQPSGIDYIIHALGEVNRKDYLQSFYDADPEYVGIIREDFSAWEGYIRSANWFFYRTFLDSYTIDFANDYQYYYCKAAKEQKKSLPCTLNVEQQGNGKCLIVIDCGNDDYNGVADVRLKYSVEKDITSRKNLFCFKTLLFLHDLNNEEEKRSYLDFALPGGRECEMYIPVKVVDGVGRMELTSYPAEGSTLLSVESVQCEGFFQNALDIATVIRTEKLEEGYLLQYGTSSALDPDRVYSLQHGNEMANVIGQYKDENGNYFILDDSAENFIQGLGGMSAVQMLTK